MSSKTRSLSLPDRKKLWALSHNMCAFPQCRQQLVENVADAESGAGYSVVVGEEAHIYGFSEGGPRYDPEYPEALLESYENRILLCQTHHTIIDARRGEGFDAKTLLRMKKDHEEGLKRDDELVAAVKAYLGGQMEADDRVQFRQARLDGPTVESMFVDVPFGCREDSPASELLERISKAHPGDLKPDEGYVATGAAQALLHPEWTGNALIIGGPGQGKSTLLQYICQFHRARYLGRSDYSGDVQGLKPVTSVARIPVKIELRHYAEWALSQDSDPESSSGSQHWPPIEKFLIEELNRSSGEHRVTPERFTHLVANYPMLIALDGLDEVANLDHRESVADEISEMAGRLSPNASDLIILVATRPGHMQSRLLASPRFPRFNLLKMSAGLRLQYLNRWITVSELTPSQADSLRKTYLGHESLPHIRDLASYPMQFAILLHLLRNRGLFPKQRTELYEEYLKAFLDREETEDKDPLVSSQRTVLMQVHSYLGWHLQAVAESSGDSGQLPRTELRRLLRSYFADQPTGRGFADQLFTSMESRVLCLVEREDGFQFEVQSLREYFAALYVHENADSRGRHNSRVACFEAMVRRPYWLNVCRFFVGMFTAIEIRGIHSTLQDLMDKADPGLASHLRVVAARLLDDRSYQGQSDRELGRIVEFILKGSGVTLGHDGFLDDAGAPLVFSEDAGRKAAVEWLKRELSSSPAHHARSEAIAASLRRNSTEPEDVRSWWWSEFSPTLDWLTVASELGVVALERDKQLQLTECLSAAKESGDWWGTELLLLGEYDGEIVEISGSVCDELNDGMCVKLASPATRLEALCTAAMVMMGTSDSTLWRGLEDFVARNPECDSDSQVVSASVALGRAATVQDGSDWRRRLVEIDRIWGPGWVLGHTVTTAPLSIDLDHEALLMPSGGAAAEATHREAQLRSHRDDPTWWDAQLPEDPLQQRLWLFAVFSHARSSVLTLLIPRVDEIVRGLRSKHYRSLQLSLKRMAPAALDLQEPLRLNLIDPDVRTLWLIRGLCTEGTRSQIDKRIRSSLSEVLAAGVIDTWDLFRAVGASKTTPVAMFRGCRSSVSGGGLEHLRLGVISMALAREVVAAPEEWPVAIVSQALGRASSALAQLPPFGQIATKEGWFPGSDD